MTALSNGNDSASLAALIGSRICHDLISPIGAISNGLELLGMTGVASGSPELALVHESCENAAARIRFFRVAFGNAADAHAIAADDARRILADHYAGTRIVTQWQPCADLPRNLVQLLFLAVLCAEHALPQGGTITVEDGGTSFRVRAFGDRFTVAPGAWAMLKGCRENGSAVAPSQVQFLLLGALSRDSGAEIGTDEGQDAVTITLTPAGAALPDQG